MNKSKIKKIIEKNNGIVTASEVAENSIRFMVSYRYGSKWQT